MIRAGVFVFPFTPLQFCTAIFEEIHLTIIKGLKYMSKIIGWYVKMSSFWKIFLLIPFFIENFFTMLHQDRITWKKS
jgi:hypothetical protein